MFVFRIYCDFESSLQVGFDITLTALNEKEALEKAKKTVVADRFRIREVIQKTLWKSDRN